MFTLGSLFVDTNIARHPLDCPLDANYFDLPDLFVTFRRAALDLVEVDLLPVSRGRSTAPSGATWNLLQSRRWNA
jgi:hypothetical protein